jgi:secernin
MGCDMVVAMGPATATGHTFFGTNSHGPVGICQVLTRVPGRTFAPGESAGTQHIDLPQARQTFTVLGSRPPHAWGYRHGINEHQLVAACAAWQSKLPRQQPGLLGTDLVRLLLERCKTARQGFELLTSLVAKHGQSWPHPGGSPGYSTDASSDHIFLLADSGEAYLVEAAGSSWASLECHGVRAVSNVGLIRQDWQRLSPGLAEQVIAQGWWQDDGSKLDFSASLSADQAGTQSALRRWGRATLLLEQQHGSIDATVLRRILSDHYDGTSAEIDPLVPAGPIPLCRHAGRNNNTATAASFIAQLMPAACQAMAWCAYGPPCATVYLPIFLDGDLPEMLSRGQTGPDLNSLWWRAHTLLGALNTDVEQWAHLRSSLALLQGRIDQEAEDFCADAGALKKTGEPEAVRRQTTLFMQSHAELLEAEFQRIQRALSRRTVAASQ